MAKKKRHFLATGMPVAACESDQFCFEVRPGRWEPTTSIDDEMFAVIVHERKRSPLKSVGVFKMVIDFDAVETVINGLQKWLYFESQGRLGDLFGDGSLPATAGPFKACGSGPCRPSPHLFERSELGEGRQGETLAGPADGFPEA